MCKELCFVFFYLIVDYRIFRKYSFWVFYSFGILYDYKFFMYYGCYYFIKNGKLIIVLCDFIVRWFGNCLLSELDIKEVCILFGLIVNDISN